MNKSALALLFLFMSPVIWGLCPSDVPPQICTALDLSYPDWHLSPIRDRMHDHLTDAEFHEMSPRIKTVLRGDFDDDGEPDFAIQIVYSSSTQHGVSSDTPRDFEATLAFLALPQGFKKFVLDQPALPGVFHYLNLDTKGTVVKGHDGFPTGRYLSDRINEINFFSKEDIAYEYEDGSFKKYSLTDD